MNLFKIATISVLTNGLVVYSSIPTAKNRSLSPFSAFAVNAMIGICFLSKSSSKSNISCVASIPSSTGICISINITSKSLFLRFSKASKPLLARVISSPKSSNVRFISF